MAGLRTRRADGLPSLKELRARDTDEAGTLHPEAQEVERTRGALAAETAHQAVFEQELERFDVLERALEIRTADEQAAVAQRAVDMRLD